ncbi:hypothetical protein ZWY2020_009033 [Hordeum vulgare]|nr:hypothetical protein ZWY2020_009033 [Hordeum vulgare]
MGTLNVTILLCLLLVMPLHLVPGSKAKMCEDISGTYTPSRCDEDKCVEACHKEGFTQGECGMVWGRKFMMLCFCKKQC